MVKTRRFELTFNDLFNDCPETFLMRFLLLAHKTQVMEELKQGGMEFVTASAIDLAKDGTAEELAADSKIELTKDGGAELVTVSAVAVSAVDLIADGGLDPKTDPALDPALDPKTDPALDPALSGGK